MVDLIDFDLEGKGDIVTDHLEAWVAHQVDDVVLGRRVVVVDTQHFVAVVKQALTQMRADEAGATCDQSSSLGNTH